MKKPDPKELSTQLMDYRDIPAPEIAQWEPFTAPPFAFPAKPSEEWALDPDGKRKVDFEA